MNIRKIKKLIQIVCESNIHKLEISEDNKTICITCFQPTTPSNITYSSINTESQSITHETTDNKIRKKINEHIIRAPMVGTLYLAPNIDTKPFVSIGQFVKSGDILCIIEAMKTMNHIQSDITGTIKSILHENGQPVEFDAPLFIIG